MPVHTAQSDESTDKALNAEVVVPRAVARAIQYMRNHLTVPLNSAAIAAASGTPERTLRRQFRRFTGMSPVVFHRNLRLSAVRRALREQNAETDVSSAAGAFGFSHFGRFTGQYRECFGELPSETLLACRQTLLRLPFGVRDPLTVTVLPFVAANNRIDEASLADSMTESVTSALSRLQGVNVLTLKHRAAVTDHAPPAYAQYAVRGRVKSSGPSVQVVIKLFEIATARHIWGDAFEAAPDHTSALREKVIEHLARALSSYVRNDSAVPQRRPERDPLALELVRRAFGCALEITEPANARALEDLDRVRSIDCEFPLAIALDACCIAQRAICFFGGALHAQLDRVRHLTSLALSIDNEDPTVLALLGWSATCFRDYDLAEMLVEKSLAINPLCVLAWQRRGWIAAYHGESIALTYFKRALSCSPSGGERFNTMLGISHAHFNRGDYGPAADWAVRALQQRPSESWACRMSAAAQARAGQKSEARGSILRLRHQYPDVSVTSIINVLPDYRESLARTAEALESAGLPV